MKPFSGTALLSVFVLLVAGYTAWEYKNAALHSGDTAEEKRLFFFMPEQVSQFKLTRGTETLLVVRDGDDWNIKQPVEDQAERSAVEAFLYSVMIQKGKTFRSSEESKNTKYSEFGLEPAGATIEVTANGKTESLAVSSKNAYDGSYYIRQGNEVMLGDHGLAQIVGRDSSTLRSKRLWRERDAVIQSAHVEVNLDKVKDSYDIKKIGDQWSLDPKPAYAVDNHKIEQWLTSLSTLNPNEIASETQTDDEKRSFLLLKPSLTVDVKLKKSDGKEGDWKLSVGQDRSDDIFLFTNQRSTVYKTQAVAWPTLRVSREYFREGKSPFKFSVEQAHDIQMNGRHVQKDGSEWKLVDAGTDAALDVEKLKAFLQNLTSVEALEFPPAKNAKGFKPDQHILIRDSKGQTLLDLSWGDDFKAQQSWNKGMTFRFVKTNLEKEVLGVNAAKVASLVNAGFVTVKAENKKTDNK